LFLIISKLPNKAQSKKTKLLQTELDRNISKQLFNRKPIHHELM
jgi:hypothetical protein